MAELSSRPARWRSVRAQAGTILLVAVLLLLSGFVALRIVAASTEQLEAASAKARLQSETARDVVTTLQAAESGQRGFLLTGRAAYLDPYHTATAAIDGLLGALNALADGTPWMQSDSAELTRVARLKMAELADTIGLAQVQGAAAAMPLVLTDNGRALMESARTVASRISVRADIDRNARAGKLHRRQLLVSRTVLVVLVGGVVLLAAAALRLLWTGLALQRARDRVRAEAARLHAAVEHVPEGVAVFDAADRLMLRNSRFASALGIADEHAGVGASFAAVAAAASGLEPPLFAGPRPGLIAETAEAKQGSRVLDIWRSAMPDGGQMVAVADITRRTQAEAIARQAQKMEMIGQMTGGIAHDFNNLLQVVSANLELVARRLEQAGTEAIILSRLEQASASVQRGAQITRHLLAFARRQPLAPEPLDPARLLISLEDMLRRTLGEAIELEVVIGAGLWSMRADPSQIESALLNLTLNARDAMKANDASAPGRVTIQAENITLDAQSGARHQDGESVAPGDYVVLAVTDNGTGMTPEQLGHATDPFYTTKPDGKGTGLGLSMVFGFAKQSGGHFVLTSEVGRGTTAQIYIPRTTAPIGPQPHAASFAGTARGEMVLLVEDDPSVRRVAAAALHSLGYGVSEAGNGDEALALLNSGLRPDVLFTDVVMPGTVSARELATRARLMMPGLAVLFTTGYTQEEIVHEGQLDEGVNLITKPWRTENLGEAIQAALDNAPKSQSPTRRRVLLVEDEPLVRMITADALADLGFDVLEADSAAAALARLQPPPDLMLSDLGLPDMEGAELILRARAALPGLRVIVASGRSESPVGDVVFLAKPYDRRDLERAVDRALNIPALAET